MEDIFYIPGEQTGLGVILDGTVGFMNGETKDPDGNIYKMLRLYPLKRKMTPGETLTEDDINREGNFIELAFGSPTSIDVTITALNTVKKSFER